MYSIKLYISITAPISWASSTCVLLVMLRQLINGAQFLNTTFLLTLFAAVPSAEMSAIVMSASIYVLL